MILANGEVVIRSWDYATITSQNNKTKTVNLTVTNERMVYTQSNNTFMERKELPLKSIKSIEAKCDFNKSAWLVCLIIGLIALVAGIIMIAPSFVAGDVAMTSPVGILSPVIGILLFIVGLILLIVALVNSRKANQIFCLVLHTDLPAGNVVTFGSAAYSIKSKKTQKANNIIDKISLNPTIAREVVEEIGSIVVAARNGDYSHQLEK